MREPQKKTARIAGGQELVEAAGQPFRLFRGGLDYAFILHEQDAGRVIRAEADPSTRPPAWSRSASL